VKNSHFTSDYITNGTIIAIKRIIQTPIPKVIRVEIAAVNAL
jgi:hypothetical protein